MLMNTLGRTAMIVGLVAFSGLSAHAQGVQQYDIGQYFVENVRAYCGDFATVVRPDAPDLIAAPNFDTIIINGPAFDALPPGVRLFAYYQTCGMVFYGNDLALADASAARTGATQRWLSVADVETICGTDALVQAGWSNAPDAMRCEAIKETMRKAVQ